MTDLATTDLAITDPALWRLPLQERMAHFIAPREAGPFWEGGFVNPMTGEYETFLAVTRYDDVVDISRRPADFCSGKGATSIPDMPPEGLEFFGGFINMDDPRHARQRGIVSRKFTPRQLAGVLDSVQSIATEVVDGICEQGEVDLVETISQPFPLLIICDMMGIPRDKFETVLRCTNTILGGGDPEFLNGIIPAEDPEGMIGQLLGAGMELTQVMHEVAAERREHPEDDLTTALVHADSDEDMLDPSELASFFILLAVAGNDTTRTAISRGMDLLAKNPEQRQIWQDDLAGVTPTAVEEIVRASSPVTFMRRTTTKDIRVAGEDLDEGTKLILFYGAANRDPRAFEDPETFDVRRDPNPHVGFGGPGPHFCLGAHLARREVSVIFNELFNRLPDIQTTAEPVPLDAAGIPLVGGVKRLPVTFTPSKPVGVG